MQEKDDQLQAKEIRLKEHLKLENEVQFWRKKAEATPSAQVLKGELENLKVNFDYLN